ncbi:50S ribosomal protein L21 [Brevundimonas lutea]|uniref:50S ribosomal protein L21 n=1 Tax=Brevundimonas lutea TaxID=2293980 RepID=UPI000F0437CC|nr:50S ribosomal protein L21 [Brevundimonas lutea]
MYAVIKTGGKQYRVQPGDVIVVEKLDGDTGADITFDDVLMLGGDKGVTLGAPLVAGASVAASLVETRKGEKIKVFKKIRRQGYRRTNGHRQMESVLRITGISGKDENAKWDGKAETLTLAEKNARARGLAPRVEAEAPKAKAKPAAQSEIAETEAKAPKAEAKTTETKKAAAPKTAKAETAEKPAAKKAPAKKADKAGDDA